MAKGKYKYHYFYKITNLINNHFYYGIHSTNNINDGYMGSGSRLHHAYKKYGIENFEKEILKYFDTREELAQYEADVVTEELVLDQNCYNISCGGEKWNTLNSISVKDKNGNCFRCKANDPKWLNGEYVQCTKNTVTVRDVDGNKFRCSYDDEKYISGEYKNITQGLIFCKDTSTNKYTYKEPSEIDNIRYISKDSSLFHGLTFGKVLVKDKNNKYLYVNKDDENYLNGKLKFMIDWKGRHHKEETKQKMHNTFLKNNHQQGEKNSQYGTCWIHNNSENKKIKKEQLEEYMSNGWIKGRKMKFK